MGGQNPIDVYIGGRIQIARATAGIAREALAGGLEITPEELTAYELGTARVSAAVLFSIAEMLKQRIGFFYEGLGSECISGWPVQ